jgi:hypothetical protein
VALLSPLSVFCSFSLVFFLFVVGTTGEAKTNAVVFERKPQLPQVGVTHWDSLEKQQVALGNDLNEFLVLVRLAFSDSLTGQFRMYTLPQGFDDINQRRRIDTDEAYLETLHALLNVGCKLPLIYIWNVPSGSSE